MRKLERRRTMAESLREIAGAARNLPEVYLRFANDRKRVVLAVAFATVM